MPSQRGSATGLRAALALVGWLALCFAVGIAGSFFSLHNIPTWYAKLIKPPFTPPNAVFSIVWPILYALMAVAAWLAWKTPRSTCRFNGLRLFGLQLWLNFFWAWIFFGRHAFSIAFIDLVALWIALFVTILNFRRISTAAAWLLVPYLAFVTFIGYLNLGFWKLN